MSDSSSPKRGPRTYGYDRQPEDVTRCVEGIMDRFALYQCSRARGHGPEGLYCKQHDPAAVQRRAEEAERLRDKDRERTRQHAITTALRDATVEQLREELRRREAT